MTNQLKSRSRSEAGFTLVELLVVMLIIGLLAAIAIPAFFNQRNKANDAGAKETVRSAQTAMETWATDHSGSYNGAGITELDAIEPTIPNTQCASGASLVGPCTSITITGSGTGYTVTVGAKTTNNSYSITRDATGNLTYPCARTASTKDAGGCTITGSSLTGTWN